MVSNREAHVACSVLAGAGLATHRRAGQAPIVKPRFSTAKWLRTAVRCLCLMIENDMRSATVRTSRLDAEMPANYPESVARNNFDRSGTASCQ